MSLSGLLTRLRNWQQRLGVRVVAFACLAVIAAFTAPLLDPYLPEALPRQLGVDAVLPILNILASSMLAVTTFSLGIMVQALRAASNLATPRAYRVVMQDSTTQNVLATFTGAFLFSLTAIVMFQAGYYSDSATVVVFGLTILMIIAIVLAILRWIEHLSHLGSMDHTLDLVQRAATGPLRELAASPTLGARRATTPLPTEGTVQRAPCSGYVQYIDFEHLNDVLQDCDAHMWITAPPGRHVLTGAPLAVLTGNDPDTPDLAEAFAIAPTRTLEQDVRFGLVVLNEVGMRALSPGINDPGTAIDVINRLTVMLHEIGTPQEGEILYPRISLTPASADDLVQDAYHTLIRDGAARPEIATCLISALTRLRDGDWDDLGQAAEEALTYLLQEAEAQGVRQETLQDLKSKACA